MLTITEAAVKELETLIAEQPVASPAERANLGLRLSIERGGCSGMQYLMVIGQGKADDTLIQSGQAKVFVDKDCIHYLQGSKLDYEGGLTGAGFRIQNPNAARTCGCGTSFSTTQDQ